MMFGMNDELSGYIAHVFSSFESEGERLDSSEPSRVQLILTEFCLLSDVIRTSD